MNDSLRNPEVLAPAAIRKSVVSVVMAESARVAYHEICEKAVDGKMTSSPVT